jgi:hypothetical protein
MNIEEVNLEITHLDVFDKLKIYIHYYATNLLLKYSQYGNKQMPNHYTFEEFINPNNKGYWNSPEDWKHNFGIYDWYWKFKDQIKL